MKKITEEHMDNLLGGLAIMLVGILLSSSAIWGLVDDVYSMNGGPLPVAFIILGIGSIILGLTIFLKKPEGEAIGVSQEKPLLSL